MEECNLTQRCPFPLYFDNMVPLSFEVSALFIHSGAGEAVSHIVPFFSWGNTLMQVVQAHHPSGHRHYLRMTQTGPSESSLAVPNTTELGFSTASVLLAGSEPCSHGPWPGSRVCAHFLRSIVKNYYSL